MTSEIRVIVGKSPFSHEREEVFLDGGQTIEELMTEASEKTNSNHPVDDHIAYLVKDDTAMQVPQENWKFVKPKQGTYLVIRPVPGLALFVGLSAAFTAFQGAIAALGFFGKLLMAGITFGIKFLINKLFAPKQKKGQDAPEPKVGYSISTSRNDLAPYQPIPWIFGVHRVTPYMAATPYTEVIGNDQYIRLLFLVGYGPLSLSSLKIGETPIEYFKNCTVQIKQGFSGDPSTSLFPLSVYQLPLDIKLTFAAGYFTQTTGTDITEIQVDFLWQNGLIFIDEDGSRWNCNTRIQWGFRKVGDIPWIDMPLYSVVAKTQDTLRRTREVTVTKGQYEVRVKKAQAELVPKSTQYIAQDVVWTALRGMRSGEPITFDEKPLCLVAMRIKATGQLNGVVDTFNCVAYSLVKSYNGTSWVANQPSARPADLIRHALQGPGNYNPITDAEIDLVALQQFWAYAGPQGFTYNKPLYAQTSVEDLVDEIATSGRAMKVFKDGKWSVVWDEQNPPIVGMISPRNSWGFEWTTEYDDPPHAVRMPFVNADKKWAQDERVVYADGYSKTNATRFFTMEMPGVTNKDALWKHGRYHLAQISLRPTTYFVNLDMEGLPYVRNDRLIVVQDSMSLGLGQARVTAVVGQTISFDDPVTLSSTYPIYTFQFRSAANVFFTRNCSGVTGTFSSITMSGTGTVPAVGDLMTYGIYQSDSSVMRISEITTSDDFTHKLTLVDDAPGISLADTGSIPPFDANLNPNIDPFEQPPVRLKVTDVAYSEGGFFFERLIVTWDLPHEGKTAYIEINWRDESDEDLDLWHFAGTVKPPTELFNINRLDPGLYTVRIRALFYDRTFSDWVYSAVYNAAAASQLPADVDNFAISVIGPQSTFTWKAVLGTSVVYDMRYSPLLTGVTWNTSTPLLTGITGTSVQTPTNSGTFLIRARLPTGLQSANASLVVTNLGDIEGMNAVEQLIETTPWAGVHDGTEVFDGDLRLQGRAVISDWVTMSSVIDMQQGDGSIDNVGFLDTGTYYFPGYFDLGEIHTSRVSSQIDASGYSENDLMSNWLKLSTVPALNTSDPESWSVELQRAVSQVDPGLNIWDDWATLSFGDITFRAIKFRLILTGLPITDIDLGTTYSVTSPLVNYVIIDIDMPDRDILGLDLVVPVSGLAVAFTPPFRALKGLTIGSQDMNTGDREAITLKTNAGFTIQYLNSGGSPVQRTFDYHAKGYGKVL